MANTLAPRSSVQRFGLLCCQSLRSAGLCAVQHFCQQPSLARIATCSRFDTLNSSVLQHVALRRYRASLPHHAGFLRSTTGLHVCLLRVPLQQLCSRDLQMLSCAQCLADRKPDRTHHLNATHSLRVAVVKPPSSQEKILRCCTCRRSQQVCKKAF